MSDAVSGSSSLLEAAFVSVVAIDGDSEALKAFRCVAKTDSGKRVNPIRAS